MTKARALSIKDKNAFFATEVIERRKPRADDVVIDIDYCGVCHSDLHCARGEWPGSLYPCVPGHEIIGRVVETGTDVARFKVGQRVGVGCMVDSCGVCDSCLAGLEQYCYNGNTGTYNSPDVHIGGHTFGGYSTSVVVDQRFVLSIPDTLPSDAAAPLLCAGITLFSPLKHWRAGPGKRVAIVGLGGLGHMGVKLARAMGATVVVITSSPAKAEDAFRLGAHEVLVSTSPDEMAKAARTLDLILNTVSAVHDYNAFMRLLRIDGAQVLLGIPPSELAGPHVMRMVANRLTLAASTIGGIAETQEMLDFCAQHAIVSDIEIIGASQIETAWERMVQGDVRYRFVLDTKTIGGEPSLSS